MHIQAALDTGEKVDLFLYATARCSAPDTDMVSILTLAPEAEFHPDEFKAVPTGLFVKFYGPPRTADSAAIHEPVINSNHEYFIENPVLSRAQLRALLCFQRCVYRITVVYQQT
jgi:hypothetical protein